MLRLAVTRNVGRRFWHAGNIEKSGCGCMATILDNIDTHATKYKEMYIKNNLDIFRQEYSWEKLVDEHEKYFRWMLEQKR